MATMSWMLAVMMACCLAYVHADCGASQIATVRRQARETFENNDQAKAQFAQACIQRMASEHPEAIPPDMTPEELARTMLQRLQMALGLLGNQAAVEAKIEEIQASGRPFNPSHYVFHLENVLEVIPGFIGSSFDEAAWDGCISWLTDIISQA